MKKLILAILLLCSPLYADSGIVSAPTNPLTLHESAGNPPALANSGKVFTKDVAGVTELFYENSAGVVMQISSGGAMPSLSRFILQQADVALPNAQDLSALSSGVARVTTGTGVISTTNLLAASMIVSSHALATFTHTAGTQLKGNTLNNFSLNWTYNRNSDDPASQTINQGIGAKAVNLRTHALVGVGLTANTTYTISAVGDDVLYGAAVGNPSSLSTTVTFTNYRYYGVTQSVLNTDTAVKAALSHEFEFGRAVTKTFDASAGGGNNYLEICYPASLGNPASTTFNGFAFTDYTVTTISNFDNGSSLPFLEDFKCVTTNNTYSGAGIVWSIQ
jgi:hypothetical protein